MARIVSPTVCTSSLVFDYAFVISSEEVTLFKKQKKATSVRLSSVMFERGSRERFKKSCPVELYDASCPRTANQLQSYFVRFS